MKCQGNHGKCVQDADVCVAIDGRAMAVCITDLALVSRHARTVDTRWEMGATEANVAQLQAEVDRRPKRVHPELGDESPELDGAGTVAQDMPRPTMLPRPKGTPYLPPPKTTVDRVSAKRTERAAKAAAPKPPKAPKPVKTEAERAEARKRAQYALVLAPDADAHPERCRVQGCPRDAVTRGLCRLDYDRARGRGGSLLDDLALVPTVTGGDRTPRAIVLHPDAERFPLMCRVCQQRAGAAARGLCSGCHGRARRAHLLDVVGLPAKETGTFFTMKNDTWAAFLAELGLPADAGVDAAREAVVALRQADTIAVAAELAAARTALARIAVAVGVPLPNPPALIATGVDVHLQAQRGLIQHLRAMQPRTAQQELRDLVLHTVQESLLLEASTIDQPGGDEVILEELTKLIEIASTVRVAVRGRVHAVGPWVGGGGPVTIVVRGAPMQPQLLQDVLLIPVADIVGAQGRRQAETAAVGGDERAAVYAEAVGRG